MTIPPPRVRRARANPAPATRGSRSRAGRNRAARGKPGGEKGSQPGGGKGGPPSQDKGNAPGESRGGESPKGDQKSEDATAQDAKGRADDLNRGSEEDKQAAAKDLKDIANKAKDPQARKAAQEALDKAREDFGKPGDKPEAPQTKPEDATGDDVKQLAAKASGNDPAGRAQARGQLGDIANKAKDEKARKGAREELDKAWKDWVKAAQDNPRQREKAGKQRPNMLQLEKFRETVDPNILKDMKMTKEQFDQFMRDYADLANRTLTDGADDKHVPVGGAPGTLPAMRGTPTVPATGTNDPRGGRPALPPPEYRDSRTELLRRLNIPR